MHRNDPRVTDELVAACGPDPGGAGLMSPEDELAAHVPTSHTYPSAATEER